MEPLTSEEWQEEFPNLMLMDLALYFIVFNHMSNVNYLAVYGMLATLCESTPAFEEYVRSAWV